MARNFEDVGCTLQTSVKLFTEAPVGAFALHRKALLTGKGWSCAAGRSVSLPRSLSASFFFCFLPLFFVFAAVARVCDLEGKRSGRVGTGLGIYHAAWESCLFLFFFLLRVALAILV